MQSLDLHSFIQYFFSSWLIWVILFTDATDIWQPVDAGYGWLVKKLISKAQDNWLELDENIDTAKPPNTLPRIALTPILHCFELGLKILQIHWFFRVTLFL